jgi:hypothetical protein
MIIPSLAGYTEFMLEIKIKLLLRKKLQDWTLRLTLLLCIAALLVYGWDGGGGAATTLSDLK